MGVIIARTENALYVIDAEAGCVARHHAAGGSSMIPVSSVMSARPLSGDGPLVAGELIRGPLGQALVLMPETAWRPVTGRTMVLQVRDGARIITTPVTTVSGGIAHAA